MQRLFPVFLVCLVLGCASKPQQQADTWNPRPEKIREIFDHIQNPYRGDAFASHAFDDGFMRAYSLGRGSLGALYETPSVYKEKQVEEAYRAGWDAGATLAFREPPIMKPLPK
jgi:hypothetical protein